MPGRGRTRDLLEGTQPGLQLEGHRGLPGCPASGELQTRARSLHPRVWTRARTFQGHTHTHNFLTGQTAWPARPEAALEPGPSPRLDHRSQVSGLSSVQGLMGPGDREGGRVPGTPPPTLGQNDRWPEPWA